MPKKSIYECQTGEELLQYFFSIYDIMSMSEPDLVCLFSELFSLDKKKVNYLELAVLSGRIKNLVQKYDIQKK